MLSTFNDDDKIIALIEDGGKFLATQDFPAIDRYRLCNEGNLFYLMYRFLNPNTPFVCMECYAQERQLDIDLILFTVPIPKEFHGLIEREDESAFSSTLANAKPQDVYVDFIRVQGASIESPRRIRLMDFMAQRDRVQEMGVANFFEELPRLNHNPDPLPSPELRRNWN